LVIFGVEVEFGKANSFTGQRSIARFFNKEEEHVLEKEIGDHRLGRARRIIACGMRRRF
jgi:hypothetical protein